MRSRSTVSSAFFLQEFAAIRLHLRRLFQSALSFRAASLGATRFDACSSATGVPCFSITMTLPAEASSTSAPVWSWRSETLTFLIAILFHISQAGDSETWSISESTIVRPRVAGSCQAARRYGTIADWITGSNRAWKSARSVGETRPTNRIRPFSPSTQVKYSTIFCPAIV